MKFDSALLVKFLKFGCIGGVVYLFDASCYWLLGKEVGITNLLARGISVALAMALSWWLNRKFTFHTGETDMDWGQLFKFMLSQLPGACLNWLASSVAFHYVPIAMGNYFISTAVGSCAGLCANFVMANVFVFNKKKVAG